MRVSLDDGGSQKRSSSPTKEKGKGAKGGGGPLDKAQKIKAIVASVVIVLAGVFIAYSQGLFDSTPAGGTALEPTPEVLEQIRKQAEQDNVTTGGTRLAPSMPLGAQ
ncbi:MAG: hypothetical protein ACK4WH_06310 [Phycisphaerales bacterium]